MKNFLYFFGASALIVTLSGCAAGAATYYDAPGVLYAKYSMAREAQGQVGSKSGKACATSILGWISTGDASVTAAAANGGITKVSSIDRDVENILSVYATYCTVVHGE